MATEEKEKPKPRPQLVTPVSSERLEQMKKRVPYRDESIFSSFEGEGTDSVPKVVGSMLGLQNKDVYSILERTNIPQDELVWIRDLIRQAEHGIGTPESLDIPVPYIAEQVVTYLRARTSVTDALGHGMSRDEVENILTAWSRILEARDAELKKQQKGVAG
jgi:hypothetical protein